MLVLQDVIVEIRRRVVPIRLFPVFTKKAAQTSPSGHAGAVGCSYRDPQARYTDPTFPGIHPQRSLPIMLVLQDVIVEIRKSVILIRLFRVFTQTAAQTSPSGHAGVAGCSCGDPQERYTDPTFPGIHPNSSPNVPFRSCWCSRM